jgi:hypothetical protein
MILRRLAQAIRVQNWFTVVIELFIVIVGVYLGLQAENWNQARIERQAAIDYHGRLVEELRSNQENLRDRRDYYLIIRDHGQAALDALRAGKPELEAQFLIDAYRATYRWPLEIDRAVYDEVLRAGVLSMISDIDARSRLTNYYVIFEGVMVNLRDDPAYRNLVRAYLPVDVQRLIETDCPEVITTGVSGALLISFPECDPKWSDAVVDGALESLLAAPELTTTLNRRMSNMDNKLTLLQRNIERSSDLAEYLESVGP